MRTYRITWIGLAVSIGFWLIAFVGDIDLFEQVIALLQEVEHFEVDEIIIPLSVLVLFVLWDLLRKRKTAQLELEKVKVYKAMLTATHHILNNFMNQMQLFKLTAEETPDFDPEVLALYDRIINDAALQIEALGALHNIDEGAIHASVGTTKHA